MNKSSKIYVAGATGMVGSAIVRKLLSKGYENIITYPHKQLDLTNQEQVSDFFKKIKPEYVFLSAGKIGGVYANNTYRAEFIFDNLMIECNVIHNAFLNEVKRLIFFAGSGIYPKNQKTPFKESDILKGPLEETNEPCALAQISGIKLCESYNRQYGTDFVSIVPTNLYGINQNYEPMNTVVIPALIRRCHEAKLSHNKNVFIWGSGDTVRDFLFTDDLADAAFFLMTEYKGNEVFNVGSWKEYSIIEIAKIIKNTVGYTGDFVLDRDKPEGVKRKIQNLEKIYSLGWKSKTTLEQGLMLTYQDFLKRF